MVFVFLMAPLNLAGAEAPGSAASARRRSARNGMLHAGRPREPGTTDGVIVPAAVAVGQSDGRWETFWPACVVGGCHSDRPGMGAVPVWRCVVRRFVLWRCVHAFDGSGDIGQPSLMRAARGPQRNCHDARNVRRLWWSRRNTDTRTLTQCGANFSFFCGFPCSFIVFGGATEGIRCRIAGDAGASCKGRSICKRRSVTSRRGRRACRPDPGRGQLASSGCLTFPPMRFPLHLSGSVDSFTPFCVRCGCVGLSVLAVGPAVLWPRHRWWTCFAVLLLPSLWFACMESSSPSAFCCCVVVLGGCSRLFSLSRFALGASALSSVGRLGYACSIEQGYLYSDTAAIGSFRTEMSIG